MFSDFASELARLLGIGRDNNPTAAGSSGRQGNLHAWISPVVRSAHRYRAQLHVEELESRTTPATHLGDAPVTLPSYLTADMNPSAASIQISAPNNVTAGVAFNVTITAKDSHGNIAASDNDPITLISTDGQSLQTQPASLNLTIGIATISVTLDKSGSTSLRATASSHTTTSNRISIAPGAAESLQIAAPMTATAGNSFKVTVTAKDAFGNTATAMNGVVALRSSDGQTLFGLPTKINLSNGVANLNAILDRADGVQLSATISGFVAQSGDITVAPASAATLFVVAPTTGAAGVGFTVKVTDEDRYGNVITNFNGLVTLSSSDGQLVYQSPGPIMLVNGVGSTTVSLDRADSVTIRASNGQTSGRSALIAVAAGAPATFSISTPSGITAGQAFYITVSAKDAFGNAITRDFDQLAITSGDGQPVYTVPDTVSLANGTVKFHATMYVADSTRLIVTDSATNAKGTSNSITISPTTFSRFDVITPTTVITGVPFTVTIEAADQYANPVTTFSGSVSLTCSDYAQVMTVSPNPIYMSHGIATVTVTMSTADTCVLIAGTGWDNATWGESFPFTVVSTAPVSLNITAPTTATAGTSFDVTISGVDALGESACIVPASVTFTAGDGQPVTAKPLGNLPDGSATFAITMNNADVTTLSASVSGIMPAISNPIAIQGGVATKLVVSAPNLAVAGIGLPVTIAAQDQFGNFAAGFTGQVTITASDGQQLSLSTNPINLTNGTAIVYVTMNVQDQLTLQAKVGTFAATSGTITVGSPDWFSANLNDLVVQAYARADFVRDGSITFSDMLGLLSAVAAANPTITATGIQTLQFLVSPAIATYLNLPPYVQNLADKVINGDPANAEYQGAPLGNLQVGSGSTQFQNLINKWFLGEDRPAIGMNSYSWNEGAFLGTAYQPISGKLFGSAGPSDRDVSMGWSEAGFDWSSSSALASGFDSGNVQMYEWNVDSSLMASLEEVAAEAPSVIQNMFIDDGTVTVNGQSEHLWTVRFYNNGTPEYVTVDNYLPLWDGLFYYADEFRGNIASTNILWPALAEKALAELAGSGWSGLLDSNSYQSLDDMYVHGNSALILPLLTGGQQVTGDEFASSASLSNALAAGHLITLLTSPYGTLPADMDYAVTGYDASTQMFTLLSPWGVNSSSYTGWQDQFEMDWSDIQSNFYLDGDCLSGNLAATSIQVSAPLQAMAGTSFPITLTALDQNGNIASGFNGPVTLTASDGQQLNLTPSTVNLYNGTATVTVTLSTPDTVTIDASAAGISGASGNIEVNAAATDWFSQNMSDLSLQDEVRADFTRDGSITYRDMLDLFSEAESEGATVSASEMQSLQALVTPSGSAFLKMTPDVQNLAFKVIDGDQANAVYQSISLGNLAVGSSESQLQDLVNKWFLGMDMPATTDGSIYVLANGTLFGPGGPSYQDVFQGAIGDCWLMASFAETAARDPSIVQSMFTNDGTAVENGQTVQIWTIRFYNNGAPEYVTVNNLLPELNGDFYYANYLQNINNPGSVLWVALAEKAYAELCGSGWTDQAPINSYASLAGGWGALALPAITGEVQSTTKDFIPYSNDYVPLENAFETGNLITLATMPTYDYIVPDHDYALINYNPTTQVYTLLNPWGWDTDFSGYPGLVQMTWGDIEVNFFMDGDMVPQHSSPFASKVNLMQMLTGWHDNDNSAMTVNVQRGDSPARLRIHGDASDDRAENPTLHVSPADSAGFSESLAATDAHNDQFDLSLTPGGSNDIFGRSSVLDRFANRLSDPMGAKVG